MSLERLNTQTISEREATIIGRSGRSSRPNTEKGTLVDNSGPVRTNTGRVIQPGESRFGNQVDGTSIEDPLIDPYPQQYQGGVQKAGINWLLPLLIVGGFFVATKFKTKKKNISTQK